MDAFYELRMASGDADNQLAILTIKTETTLYLERRDVLELEERFGFLGLREATRLAYKIVDEEDIRVQKPQRSSFSTGFRRIEPPAGRAFDFDTMKRLEDLFGDSFWVALDGTPPNLYLVLSRSNRTRRVLLNRERCREILALCDELLNEPEATTSRNRERASPRSDSKRTRDALVSSAGKLETIRKIIQAIGEALVVWEAWELAREVAQEAKETWDRMRENMAWERAREGRDATSDSRGGPAAERTMEVIGRTA